MNIRPDPKVSLHIRVSDLRPHFPILVKGGSEVWVISDLFIGQTSFKTFRPQTSFLYLGERRFRDLGDIRPVHRSDLIQDSQTSDLISLSW
ncbi:hypothetical protein ACS0TY_027525 [Phlomoides rotata]